MHGPITLAGYTFTADEWSKVEADLCDMDSVGNDQTHPRSGRDHRRTAPPANDNVLDRI